jgi:multicomponent K+:H+ antiporter subunit A
VSSLLILAAIFAPLVTGGLTLLLPRNALAARVLLALLGPAAVLAILGLFIARHGLDATLAPIPWMPTLRLDLDFHADRLGLFFALLVAGIGLLVTIYARAYFGPDRDELYRFYPSLHLFMTAMLGLVLSDSFLLMLLFWELTSISSFLLIGWERDDSAAVKKALQAFVVTGAGGLALMGGLILLGVISGAWSFSDLAAAPLDFADPRLSAAFALIFVGAAAKSAQWPLHFWLPGAMAAPTPVSAYLHSATMVKAGVYLIGRLYPLLAALPAFPWLILPLGAVTMVLGAFVALQKNDLKQIFAYTTVSQLGLLMSMYGLAHWSWQGQPNLVWDLTQILNHALYKAPLFLLAGAIGHVLHTRDLSELRGLVRLGGTSSILGVLLLVAAYAMAAGPFTLSFVSKEFFFYQVVHALKASANPGFWVLVVAAVATGMFNVAIFVRLATTLLAPIPHAHAIDDHGPDPAHETEDRAHHHDAPAWTVLLWLPALALVSMQFVAAVVPGAFESLFGTLERSRFYFQQFPLAWQLSPGMPLYMSLVATTLGLLLGVTPLLRREIADVHDRLFPAFYRLVTVGGGKAFRLVQTGNARFYIAVTSLLVVILPLWADGGLLLRDPAAHGLDAFTLERFDTLLPGYLLTLLVCLAALLMPFVKERASRVLVLGTVGFSVTGVFYLYAAPDLALTQISIEIVSLILFLLVLSLLPRTAGKTRDGNAWRAAIGIAVGLTMAWLTYSSGTADRPVRPILSSDGTPVTHLGQYFLRNSYDGVDQPHYPGKDYGRGGGGNNVVNVILVDFRGYDTLGEITVLGIAALGVWTLLRRPDRSTQSRAVRKNLGDDPPHPDRLPRAPATPAPDATAAAATAAAAIPGGVA